jgi:hypothetical protein
LSEKIRDNEASQEEKKVFFENINSLLQEMRNEIESK